MMRKSQLITILTSPWLHVLILMLVVGVCYGRTLSSYFLADDFSEVAYVSRIFQGQLDLLWSSLSGNYMQIPGMNVWRPELLLSLVWDYLFWKANAFGYYLTNLTYYAGDVILVYFITRELTSKWEQKRSALASLFSAALFAVNPLHCESISWVVGRVDLISCFYYLLSFLAIIKARSTKRTTYTTVALICFWLGLLTKEMAIGLPVLVTVLGFLWPRAGEEKKFEWRLSVKRAMRLSSPFWISTLCYFGLRVLFLGTLVGGYVGGFGASQLSGMVARWLDPDILKRLMLPLNYDLFGTGSSYAKILIACYVIVGAIIVIRLMANQLFGPSWRWLVLFAVWLISAAVPIFQLWGLGFNLEGARFFFFLTVPLSLLFPILIFQPERDFNQNGSTIFNKRVMAVGAAALLVMIFTFGKTAYATNLLWVHAGKETRALSDQCQRLIYSMPAKEISANEKFIVFDIPKDRSGAHLILNGDTFATMLEPPFLKEDLSNRFITFEPIMFGPAQYINAARFKSCLKDPHLHAVIAWDRKDKKFLPVKIEPRHQELPVLNVAETETNAKNIAKTNYIWQSHIGDNLFFPNLNLSPLDADFLECELNISPDAASRNIQVVWNEDNKSTSFNATDLLSIVSTGNDFTKIRIRLSKYWRWYRAGSISSIMLRLPTCKSVLVRNPQLISAERMMPNLSVAESIPTNSGVYLLSNNNLKLVLNKQEVDNASKFEIEISKPNFFFDNFPSTGQEEEAVGKRINTGLDQMTLEPAQFSQPGFYQLRVRCLSAEGKPVGKVSDPITIQKTEL